MWADTILIVVISICTALLGEGNYKIPFSFIPTLQSHNLLIFIYRINLAASLQN